MLFLISINIFDIVKDLSLVSDNFKLSFYHLSDDNNNLYDNTCKCVFSQVLHLNKDNIGQIFGDTWEIPT